MAEYRFAGNSGFYGYDRRLAAGDGEICYMQNLTAAHAPVLSTRPPRLIYGAGYGQPQAVFGADKLYVIADGKLYADGVEIHAVSGSYEKRKIIPIAGYLIIYPDMDKYDIATGVYSNLFTPDHASFTAYGEAGKNDLNMGNSDFAMFEIGMRVSMTVYDAYYDITTVIDNELITDKYVDEDSLNWIKIEGRNFMPPIGGPAGITYAVTELRIDVPELDGCFGHDNRLWGWAGDDIRCTALGRPEIWDDYSGLATDSWAATILGSDDITGGGIVNGMPAFFCENCVYKIYGTNPTEYGYVRTELVGLKAGEENSMATGGEYVYYVSRRGIMAYNGGIPQLISSQLGSEKFVGAVGGTDGRRYYLTCEEFDGRESLLVYDPMLGYWMREDDIRAVGMTLYRGNTVALTEAGDLIALGDPWDDSDAEVEGDPIPFCIETTPYQDSWYERKGSCQMSLCYEGGADLDGSVLIKYDRKPYQYICHLIPNERHCEVIPLPAERYDAVKIRITGHGRLRVWFMVRQVYSSSERR